MSVDTSVPQKSPGRAALGGLTRTLAGLPERAIVLLASLLAWGLFVALKGPIGWQEMITTGSMDSDAVMRLAQIKDFMAGQDFYDLTHHRMNAPFGLEMHWSRLIDLPIAGLILMGNGLFGPDYGEPFAMTVWPLLVLLPVILTVCFVAPRIGRHGCGFALPDLRHVVAQNLRVPARPDRPPQCADPPVPCAGFVRGHL